MADDREQRWESGEYQHHAGFVPVLGGPVLDLLDPKIGEHILDLGCGDGALTEQLAARGARVVGIDASPDFITSARARGLDARLGDGQALSFIGDFDAVFSNAALHWMLAPDATILGVARSLKPGGRFVAECGGYGNVSRIRDALHQVLRDRGLDPVKLDPWYFPTPEEYQARLEAAGFQVDSIALIPRPTPLPTDMAGWLTTFAQSFLRAVPEEDRLSAIAATLELLRPYLQDRDGNWTADYVRLRFKARLAIPVLSGSKS